MINVNRKIEDFLHKKAGYKDFHIPQNMSFTTSSDWESTRIFLSLDKIANQKPEDLDFESWVILLEASGFARQSARRQWTQACQYLSQTDAEAGRTRYPVPGFELRPCKA